MAKKALLTVDGTYRKIKKGFLTLTSLTNMLPTPSAWTLSGVSVTNFDGFGETFVFSTGGLAMASVSLDPAIAGHKYYARCAYMTDAGFSCGDGRFEYYYTDGENMVFQTAVGNDTAGAVVTESAILSLASVTSQTGWQMRNFVVNGTTTAYRTQPILIDLTAACGAGNEPSKQWCDANIPYFIGTIGMKIPNVTAGVYRKIKKAFMTVGGVYRPCWSGGELAYYGTITPLSEKRHNGAAASNSNYAIFACGERRHAVSNTSYNYAPVGNVEAYNASLTQTVLAEFDRVNYNAATTVGETAMIAGGGTSYNSVRSLHAYDLSLTRTTASFTRSGTASYIGVAQLAGATVGEYGIFAGGENFDNDDEDGWAQVNPYAYAFTSSLTQTTPADLSVARYQLAGASVGGYALFAGGLAGTSFLASRSAVVDTYNASLTKGTAAALASARSFLSAAKVGKYAIFAGGNTAAYADTDAVDVYDESLTKVTASPLSTARRWIGATSFGGYALFAGGHQQPSASGAYTYYSVIDAYDESLTRTSQFSLSTARTGVMATAVGSFSLFGGGMERYGTGSNAQSVTTVDALTM